jgi:hypothetical protein
MPDAAVRHGDLGHLGDIKLPLERLLEASSPDEGGQPGSRLLGVIGINGIRFHVEAIQVYVDPVTRNQVPVCCSDYQALMEATRASAPWETVEIGGGEYALFIHPCCE